VLGLPIGLYGVIFYSVFNTTIVMTLGGHRKYLAERINAYFGEELLIWERIANKIIHRNISQICLHFLYAFSLIAAVLIGYYASLDYCSLIRIAYVAVIAGMSIALVVSLVVTGKAFNKAYTISKNSWGKS
jgi:hypothetical protein